MNQNAAIQISLNELRYTIEEIFECFYKVRPEIELVGELMIFQFKRTLVQEKDVDLMMFTILNVIADKEILEDVIMVSISLYQLEPFFKQNTNLQDFRIVVSESCTFFSFASSDEQEEYYNTQHDEDEEQCEEEGVYLSNGLLFLVLNDMNIPKKITFNKPDGLKTLDDRKFGWLQAKFNSFISLFHLTTFSEEEVQEKLKPVLTKLEDFEIKITHNNRVCNELLVFCLNDLSNEENIEILSELVQGQTSDIVVDLDLTYEFSYKEYIYQSRDTILETNQRGYFVRKEVDSKEVSLNTIEQIYSNYIRYTDNLRDFKRVYSMTMHDCAKYLANLFDLDQVEYECLYMSMDSCNEGIFFKKYFKDSELPAEHCGLSKEQFFKDVFEELPF